MTDKKRAHIALRLLRLSVFPVMFMQTMDKLVKPRPRRPVDADFYDVKGLGDSAFYLIGIGELVLILAFLVGFRNPPGTRRQPGTRP